MVIMVKNYIICIKPAQINFEHFKFIHKSANRRGFTQYIKLYPDLEPGNSF